MKTSGMTFGVLALTALSALPVMAYEGTGVGNGGGGFVEANTSALASQLGMPGQSRDDLAAWCGRASGLLRQELYRAQRQIALNRMETARQILIAAFRAVAQSGDGGGLVRPMVARMAERAIIISQALEEKLPGSGRIEVLSKVRFLEKFATFVVNQQAGFDRDFYIPYMTEHRGCGTRRCNTGFDFDGFEQRFFRLAVDQLQFVSDQFTTAHGSTGMIYPRGNPAVFLVLSQMMSGYVAQDIRETFEAYPNACAVMDLESLEEVLRQYNWCGDRTRFYDDADAVNEVQLELDRVLSGLSPSASACGSRYR